LGRGKVDGPGGGGKLRAQSWPERGVDQGKKRKLIYIGREKHKSNGRSRIHWVWISQTRRSKPSGHGGSNSRIEGRLFESRRPHDGGGIMISSTYRESSISLEDSSMDRCQKGPAHGSGLSRRERKGNHWGEGGSREKLEGTRGGKAWVPQGVLG